jgi:ligand-binding sensor domain-containing protein
VLTRFPAAALLGALVLATRPGLCHDASAPGLGDYRVVQWTTAQGLPQNTITDIVILPAGAVWLGTFGGLVRFDGHGFRTLDMASEQALPANRIVSLAQDACLLRPQPLQRDLVVREVECRLAGTYRRRALDRALVAIRLPVHDHAALVQAAGRLESEGTLAGQTRSVPGRVRSRQHGEKQDTSDCASARGSLPSADAGLETALPARPWRGGRSRVGRAGTPAGRAE